MNKVKKYYHPVKFYLDPSENTSLPQRTLGDVVLGNTESIMSSRFLPADENKKESK